MARLCIVLALLCCSVLAQDDKDALKQRVEQLERELQASRERGEARDRRLRELEGALEKATDALAQSQDRRGLEEEIEDYLEDREIAAPTSVEPSRLSIGGVLVMAFRGADISGGANFNTFRLEERFLRFVYRFDEKVTARYYTDGSLGELEWVFHELLQFNFGVVVVPFGQFNQRSFPDTFDTLSRPLLYLSDTDTFQPQPNQPRPVFRSVYSDTGIVASGNWWKNGNQLYYAAFVTNGLVGVNDLAGGAGTTDNNDNKQIGARVAYTISSWFERARLGVGISGMGGKYDSADLLGYRMFGIDAVYVTDGIFLRGEGSLTLRAEYVYAPREILYPAAGTPGTLVNDVNRTQGAYLIMEARLDRRWMFYIEGDWLQQRAPLIVSGEIVPGSPSITSTIWRVSLGLVHRFPIGIIWKNEYAYWDYDLGAPDAHTFATQLVVPF